MNEQLILHNIASELGLQIGQVQATIKLLKDGNTIPFITRYRKEQTGELDEQILRDLEQRYQYSTQLNLRKEDILIKIEALGKLTNELKDKIIHATKMQELEDYYLPFRPKKKTRASIAKERGLELLSKFMMEESDIQKINDEAINFVNPTEGIETKESALQGAMDIIAEILAEDADVRKWIREYTWNAGDLVVKAKDPKKRSVYEMYYSHTEPARKMPAHRFLAVNRGKQEDFLKVKIFVDEEPIFKHVLKWFRSPANYFFESIAQDSYKRLIAPSIEREILTRMMERSEEQAIHIFQENLKQLLLQPPIQGKTILGVDPAFRTGCKLAVVDPTGKLLYTDVIYPTPPQNKVEESKKVIFHLMNQFPIELIAIGNGTASRETETFIADIVKELNKPVHYVIVNEAGASVYSASGIAREEFPDLDASNRSAVSIARRLQDPLAELVKIDPKSLGVGQYQHDVSQKRLNQSLNMVIESAVNYVGVDVNTASVSLLQHVSGISETISKNVIKRREELGKFHNRKELKEIPRLGTKTYEQCIGFFRINEGEDPLDKTPIHPESYKLVEQLLSMFHLKKNEIGKDICAGRLSQMDMNNTAKQLGCGIPTLRDIMDALIRPGRDPRVEFPAPILRSNVLQLEELYIGMFLQGTVRNVVDFGAFVDIGLKNDGLVHISKMSKQFIKHPLDVVSVGDIVDVWISQVDVERERVGLSMLPISE